MLRRFGQFGFGLGDQRSLQFALVHLRRRHRVRRHQQSRPVLVSGQQYSVRLGHRLHSRNGLERERVEWRLWALGGRRRKKHRLCEAFLADWTRRSGRRATRCSRCFVNGVRTRWLPDLSLRRTQLSGRNLGGSAVFRGLDGAGESKDRCEPGTDQQHSLPLGRKSGGRWSGGFS